MFKIYNEGEEVVSFETLEQVAQYVQGMKADYAYDDRLTMIKYPAEFPAGYKAGDGFEDYFRDVYQVMQVVDVEEFL